MSKENLNDTNEDAVKNKTAEGTETVENTEANAEGKEEAKAEEKKLTVEEELEMYKDKHLRMYSEFENFRRRSAKERVELIQNAGQEMIKALLPILDDFDRAIAANQDATEVASIKEGMELIHSKIYNLLNQKGLKPMEAQGKEFNSDDYEAIAKIPAPAEDLKGKVVDVVEKGYYLNSKILRHAKVVIGE